MNEADVREGLDKLPGWSGDTKSLRREFSFADFSAAMVFVNRVAEVAEEQNHHPDIDIRYSKVVLLLSSHDAGGVTKRDLKLAEAISRLSA